MTTEELRAAMRELNAFAETPCKDVKKSALGLCLAKLSAAADDDDCRVPAEVFAELTEDQRKVAVAGLVMLTQMALVG